MKSLKRVPVGRRWGYTGLIVGFLASIAFNMADAHMERPGELGPLLLAPQAPLILFVSLEILTRTQWGTRSKGVWAARTAVAGVALISGITSYLHLHNLLQEWDPGLPAVIFPLAIDLLMVGGAASLLASTDTSPPADATPAPENTSHALDTAPTTTAPAPAVARPARRVNGRDLRVTDTVALFRVARDTGARDPSVNAVARALGVKWETARPLHAEALAEVGPR